LINIAISSNEMTDTSRQQLPSGPSTLCFNKEDFMKVCALIDLSNKYNLGVCHSTQLNSTSHPKVANTGKKLSASLYIYHRFL